MKVLRASGMYVAHIQYLPLPCASVPQKSVARIHQNNIFCNRIQEMDVPKKTPKRLLCTSVAYNISKTPF